MMAAEKQRPARTGTRAQRVDKAELTKAEYRNTMGWRLQQALGEAQLTQTSAAKKLGYTSHATIHNWVKNNVEPPREGIIALAKLTGKTVAWLEYGIDSSPVEVIPSAEKMGYALVPEVVFGESISDRREVHKWGLPVDFLKELQIVDTNLAMVYRVGNQAGRHEYGDRLLIDGGQRKAGPGEYLYWHANAPAIGNLSVPPTVTGKKAPIKVRTFAGGGEEETHEIEADKLQIIGRLRGTWRRS